MAPKIESWADRYRKWRNANTEFYARQLLSPPQPATLIRTIPNPGLVLVLGARRMGKTGAAHEIARVAHEKKGMPAVCHLHGATDPIKKKVQRMLPSWMKVTTDRSEWPEGAVIIYDEAAQSAHSRRTQSGDAVDFEALIGISGQREQLILFLAHHTRKLDPQIVRDIDMILYKAPLYAHAIWERDELTDLTWRAVQFFEGIKPETAKKRANLCISFRDFSFTTFNNPLPPWWSDGLSKLFKDIGLNGGQNNQKGRDNK